MLERLIENWLTSANERTFEVPFCQILVQQGHTLLYQDPHSPTEKGKDIQTLDPSGKPCGFQLKAGNIATSRWRSIKGEVDELIELPATHPTIFGRQVRPFLVTNGKLSPPVIDRINAQNIGNKRRRLPALTVIAGSELLRMFIDAHGTFLPTEPLDLQRLLRIYTCSGRKPFPKRLLTRLLEGILPHDPMKPLDARRAITSAILLTSYATKEFSRRSNHFALFEAWTVTASYIARTAGIQQLSVELWQPSFDLSLRSALNALDNLAQESLTTERWVASDVLADAGPPYRARVTLLLGLLSAWHLLGQLNGRDTGARSTIRHLIHKYNSHRLLWGESAVPFFAATAWFCDHIAESAFAEQQLLQVAEDIARVNGNRRVGGFPSPYHDVAECVGAACDVTEMNFAMDNPAGSSYTLEALLYSLARRGVRRGLEGIWYDVTKVHLVGYAPETPHEFLRWKMSRAELRHHFVDRPTKWKALLRLANKSTSKLPSIFDERPDFALAFLLVYPHRWTPQLVASIERALAKL